MSEATININLFFLSLELCPLSFASARSPITVDIGVYSGCRSKPVNLPVFSKALVIIQFDARDRPRQLNLWIPK